MSSTVKRLITFIIGIPLVLTLAFLPFYNHLFLNVLVLAFVFVSACEFYNICSKQAVLPPKYLLATVSLIIPAATYVFSLFGINQDFVLWILIVELILFMGAECFTAKTFENSLKKIGFTTLHLFYTSYLFSFLVRISTLPENANYFLGFFFIQVFLCDSCAWFFGVLFGKNNRGIIAASPNKSIVGFAGGIFGSVLFSVVFRLICADVLTFPMWKVVVLALITSLSTIVGDLIESVFKRSSEFKDSGNFIPGRGGALDSVDSVIISAPVFIIAITLLQLN